MGQYFHVRAEKAARRDAKAQRPRIIGKLDGTLVKPAMLGDHIAYCCFHEQFRHSISDDPSFGIYAFIESEGKESEIQALDYPDRRGEGYGLTRYNDSHRLNFSQIESQNEVRFAHKRGFVAKASTTDPTRLKQLLELAVVKTGS